jgi:hypothetical protein
MVSTVAAILNYLMDGLWAYSSDTPYSLALASLQAIPALTGVQQSPFNFVIYTGDLVSHDPDNQLSQYVSLLNLCTFFTSCNIFLGTMSCIQRFVSFFFFEFIDISR